MGGLDFKPIKHLTNKLDIFQRAVNFKGSYEKGIGL